MIVGAWSCLLFWARKIKGLSSIHALTCSKSLSDMFIVWKTFETIDSAHFIKPGDGSSPSSRLQLLHVERLCDF